MTVKGLIRALLDVPMDKNVVIEYPARNELVIGNYSSYEESKEFELIECYKDVVLGVKQDGRIV